MKNTLLTPVTLTAWIGLAFSTVACGQEQSVIARPDQPNGDVVVRRDSEKQLLRIQIPARNGKVAWSDVLQALLRAGHLNDQAMQDKMPTGSLDLRASYSRYAITAVNLLLGPDIRMQIVAGDRDQEGHLLVTVDEGAVLAKKRKVSERIRDRVTGKKDAPDQPAAAGLRLPEDWAKSDERQLLVIVLHGFNSSPERFEPLAAAFRQQGLLSGTYSYPDDQPISSSAAQLSRDLKHIASEQPQRRIALVTHSMGGLVARAALEDSELDPGNVRQLIMVAPPNQGSLLARVGYGMDLLDHAVSESERSEVSRFYAAIEDGFSEATEDLKPDSLFLQQLNSRARNPRVRYAIFLGTGGHFTRKQLDQLRQGLATAQSKSDVVGLFAPRIDATLADLDEVVRGFGDGVVAVRRGKLEGVDDIVVLEFTHLRVLQQTTFENDPLFKMVLARLKTEPRAAEPPK